jgi:hypothetical protein
MLSFKKLEDLLADKNFVILDIFTERKVVKFMIVMNLSNGISILVQIPPKYTFSDEILAIENTTVKIHSIKELDEDNYKMLITTSYSAMENVKRNMYSEIQNVLADDDMVDILNRNYNHPIIIEKHSKKIDIGNVHSQLNRLKDSVTSTGYDLAFIVNTSIVFYDKIYTFEDSTGDSPHRYKMYIIVNLETIYRKNDITSDITTITRGITMILDKNQDRNVGIISQIIDEQRNINNQMLKLSEKKIKINKNIENMQKALSDLSSDEKKIIFKISNESNEIDMEEKEQNIEILDKITKAKHDLVITIQKKTRERDTMYLVSDSVVFDNAIFMKTVLENYTKIFKIIK